MTKHPKSGANKPHPSQQNASTGAEKRDISGNVYVRGEVEIKSPIEVRHEETPTDKKKDSRDKIRMVVEIVGVVLVFIYAGLTGLQDFFTYSQWRDQGKNFRTSEHAWVNADFKSPVIKLGDSTTPPGYHFMIRNYGASPALNIRTNYYFIERPSSIPRRELFSEIEQRISAMSPAGDNTAFSLFNGQEVPVTKPRTHPDGTTWAFTQDEIDAIQHYQITLILFGKITYDDIFRESHQTSFCIYYNPKAWDGNEGWGGCPIKYITY